MSTGGVLVVALLVISFVIYWSGRYGGRARGGVSLRRGPRSHTTSKGQSKRGYATREEAETHARSLASRDGTPMSAYQCSACSKWHVGHVK